MKKLAILALLITVALSAGAQRMPDIDKMELEPLRDRLHYLVEKRFRGELNKCEGCRMCK